jgi:tight adherence protein C
MDLPASVIVGAVAVGLALPLLIFGLSSSSEPRPDPVRLNLRSDRGITDQRQRVLQESALDRAVRPAIRSLATRARRFTPGGVIEKLEQRLRLAGSPQGWTLERLLALKVVIGILGLVTAIYYLTAAPSGLTVVIAPIVGLGSYVVPDLILWGRAQERQQLIATALPDTLDQMTISVEAGLGFDAALQRVAANTRGPLAQELARTLNEVKLGAGRQQALQNLAERTNVPELRHFIYAIRQAEEYGLPVAKVLRIQAGELRVKRRQRAEERALKMPVKIVFPLVLCIFPTLFIILLGPAVIRISEIF